MSTYIKADQFYYPHGVRRGGYLELVDGKFGKHVESLPEGADVLDYSGYSIAPGLVDTHIHGFGGVDVMDNNICLLYTSPSPRDMRRSRMPSSA